MNEDQKQSQAEKVAEGTSDRVAGNLARRTAKGIVKGAGKLAGKLGLKAAFQAVGSALPVVGNAIAYATEELFERILVKAYKFFKEHKKELAALGLMMLAPGLLLFNLPLIIGGGGIIILAGTALVADLVLKIFSFFWISGAFFSIVTPIIFALIVTPLIIIFIVFIINTSAFMVPPGPRLGGSPGLPPVGQESEYMDITKTANPQGGFDNEDLNSDPDDDGRPGTTVTYQIEITATTTSLINIRYDYNCTVYQESRFSDCPDTTDPNPPLPDPPDSIEAGETISFSYNQWYANTDTLDLSDSYIVDTITVTADSPEELKTSEIDSASITFGVPPANCPLDQWPTASGYITQGAYTPSGFSHTNQEAIDIGGNFRPVFSTHAGVATVRTSSCLGNYIEIESVCEGRSFVSQFAHLEGTSVSSGQQVALGQQIGLSGNTGSCSTGAHLHYRFIYTSGGNPSYPDNPPFMWTNYIPENVPRGCTTIEGCDTSW